MKTVPSVFMHLFSNLSRFTSEQTPKVLTFGCGKDLTTEAINSAYFLFLSNTIEGINPEIVGYDKDTNAIEHQKRTSNSRITYTAERPERTFDHVMCISVLHHGLEEILPDALDLVKPRGLFCVIDYDCKGIEKENFRKLWTAPQEKRELEELGEEECHRMHTALGLRDYILALEAAGLETLFAEGELISMMGTGNTHLAYIGRK